MSEKHGGKEKFTSGGHHSKKASDSGHHKKVSHNRPADMINITNGIQRLNITSKASQPHPKPPVMVPALEIEHAKYTSSSATDSGDLHQGKGKKKQQQPAQKVGGAAFATKGLYAGAAFDNSPAASSLPIPKFASAAGGSPSSLLVERSRTITQPSPSAHTASPMSGVLRSISVEELLQSGQALSAPLQDSPRLAMVSSPLTRPLSEAEQLRIKSEYLMKVLSSSKDPLTAQQRTSQPPPNAEQLEAMTAQVRRLLNL